MKLLVSLLLIFMPDLTRIEKVEVLEPKIERFISKGQIDSAEYLAEYLRLKSKSKDKRRKATFYLYHIAKMKKDTTKLDEYFSELLKDAPKSETLNLLRDYSIYLYNQKNYSKVIEVYKKNEIEDDTVNYVVSLSYFNLGNYEKSLEAAGKSGLLDAKIFKTFLLYKTGNLEEASKLAMETNSPQILLLYLFQSQRYREYLETYPGIKEIIPRELLPYLDYYQFLSLKVLNSEINRELLERWLEVNSNHELSNNVLYLYAEELYNTKDYQKAINILNTVDTLSFFTGSEEAKISYYWLRGKIQFFRNASLSEIRKCLTYVIQNSKEVPIKDSANFFLGLSHLRFNQFRRALNAFSQIDENSNLFIYAQYYSAFSNLKLGNYEEVERILEKIMNSAKLDKDLQIKIMELKAQLYEATGKFNQAIKSYQDILRLESKVSNPQRYYEILLKIEILKYKRGDYRDIEKAYLTYYQKYPESPLNASIFYDLLFKSVYQRDTLNARKYLNLLIQNFPLSQKCRDALELYFTSSLSSLEDTTFLNLASCKNRSITSDLLFYKGNLYLKSKLLDQALNIFNNINEGRYEDEAKLKMLQIYSMTGKYQEVEIVGQDALPEELTTPTHLKILELFLQSLKMQGKSDAFESFTSYYLSKNTPYTKDIALFVANIYLKERDTANATKYLMLAKSYGATQEEILKYSLDLLKLAGEK